MSDEVMAPISENTNLDSDAFRHEQKCNFPIPDLLTVDIVSAGFVQMSV